MTKQELMEYYRQKSKESFHKMHRGVPSSETKTWDEQMVQYPQEVLDAADSSRFLTGVGFSPSIKGCTPPLKVGSFQMAACKQGFLFSGYGYSSNKTDINLFHFWHAFSDGKRSWKRSFDLMKNTKSFLDDSSRVYIGSGFDGMKKAFNKVLWKSKWLYDKEFKSSKIRKNVNVRTSDLYLNCVQANTENVYRRFKSLLDSYVATNLGRQQQKYMEQKLGQERELYPIPCVTQATADEVSIELYGKMGANSNEPAVQLANEKANSFIERSYRDDSFDPFLYLYGLFVHEKNRHESSRAQCFSYKEEFSPEVMRQIELLIDQSHDMLAEVREDNIVVSDFNASYTVEIVDKVIRCSCKVSSISKMLCAHEIRALVFLNMKISDFIPDCWKSINWKGQFNGEWPNISMFDILRSFQTRRNDPDIQDLLPPPSFLTMKQYGGSSSTSAAGVTANKKKRQYRCSICRSTDHRASACSSRKT